MVSALVERMRLPFERGRFLIGPGDSFVTAQVGRRQEPA